MLIVICCNELREFTVLTCCTDATLVGAGYTWKRLHLSSNGVGAKCLESPDETRWTATLSDSFRCYASRASAKGGD